MTLKNNMILMKIIQWLSGPMPRWAGLILFPGMVLLGAVVVEILIIRRIL
jgi:hypothetical protein